uniref:Uncharacterized protein n=1 Tax=Rhizophagus irregularis (strain DAOM 181602 / DAOM 197198 / MUCL 43194) TaxID=747089 RepID=U9U157_RHIID
MQEVSKQLQKVNNLIDELLSNDQVNLKQPRLMKPVSNRSLAESKINRVDHIANLPDKRDSNTLENLQSKKPNFKLLINTNDKILFGVVKSPKYKNSSLLACQNLIKLVNFQDSVSNVLEIITSNTLPSQFRSDYCRLPSPESVKITMLGN